MAKSDRTFPYIPAKYIPPHSYWGVAAVTLWDAQGQTIVSIMMGEGSTKLTGLAGTWGVEERPGLPPVVLWQQHDAIRQSFSLRLWYQGEPINDDWDRLRRLAQPPGPRRRPPTVYVAGPAVMMTHLPWVIEDLTMNDAERRADGRMTKLDVDITLLHYTEMEGLVRRSPAKKNRQSRARGGHGSSNRSAATRGRNRDYVVRPGDTLSGIAARVLGDASRWKEIAKLNGIRDPRRLRAHQHLKMPS